MFRLAQITKGKPFFSRYLMSERKEEDGDKLIAKPGEKEMLILYNSQEGVFSVKALHCKTLPKINCGFHRENCNPSELTLFR